MAYLADNGFRVCGMIRAPPSPRRQAAIRGSGSSGSPSTMPSRSSPTHAVPVLERLGFGATIYVPTAYIGGTSLWLDEGPGVRATGARRKRASRALRDTDRTRRPQPHPPGARRPDRGGRTGRDRAEQAGARGDDRARGPDVRLPVRLRERRRTSPRRAGRVRVCVPRQLQREPSRRRRVRHLAAPRRGDCSIEDFAALVDGRASLRTRRALAYAWRPIRRGIARLRRLG